MSRDRAGAKRIGEVARASGLSVRALHHYDAIGLLSPSARSEAGHRLYTTDDVLRLYRITALRQLGLGLADIAEALDAGLDMTDLLRRQLTAVDAQVLRLLGLHARLRVLLDSIDDGDDPSMDAVMAAMEEMAMVGQYYSEEQQRQLAERAAALGPAGMEQAQRDWAALIEEFEAARQRDADPASDDVQALVARWQALIEAFTGGDAGIRAGLQRMYEEQGPEQASRGSVDAELMAYVQRAMEAR